MSSGTLTIWQVRVEDEWRYAHPDVAAMVAICRPGDTVRLVEVDAPRTIRFASWRAHRPRSMPVTRRRLMAAEKALVRKQERAGLFAAVEAAGQPTPEARIEAFDRNSVEMQQHDRDREAKARRELRRFVSTLPSNVRAIAAFQLDNWCGAHDSHALRFILRRMGYQP